ncbi:GPI transamidase component PIG-T-like [Chenopodium quinoa]|uniref:GPI transamidase component PIG-T n=1 Tax=Chenopodium quinoa TaxID=63459 RepID=A0A803KQ03_CHEQI|nr:GPI transamidase component PIG-T-like [Chenopodium quinoa]
MANTWIFSLLIVCCFIFSTFQFASSNEEAQKEEFNEELLLKPLPDRKVLAHFHFDSNANFSSYNGGYHLHLFPMAIYQLVHKFQIKEMELSFTQGRWNYERWGGFDPISSSNAKPPGVELWAIFNSPPSQVDALWKNLTHTLSGLFCSSINFLESSTTYSATDWGFRASSGNLRYGTLPREAVCTENLTPWLKLLPCRDKAGLAELMDRPSIYRGFYHSQRLHLVSSGFDSDTGDSEIKLEQTLTVVLQPGSQSWAKSYSTGSAMQPNWSLSTVFGRKVNRNCVLAKSSNIFLHLDRGLVSELKIKGINPDFAASESSSSNLAFELSSIPDKVIKEADSLQNEDSSILYVFSIEKYADAKPFDLALTWKIPVVWSSSQAPLLANRFLMGSGNERGAIVISLNSAGHNQSLVGTGASEDSCNLHINVFQVVPWYVKVYYHTLQIYINGQVYPAVNITRKMRVSPSEDKVSPGALELALTFPCSMKSASLSLDFDKGFLHIDEYPPDANQGFDIPSALISFPDFHSSLSFAEYSNVSPILSKLQKRSPVLAYTEVLLVPLTTPDFSMPYNVITITCTVFALYFGSLLNVLRKRVGEEERMLEERAKRKSSRLHQLWQKLFARLRGKPVEQHQNSAASSSSTTSTKLIFKVALVALIAVVWQYYLR